MNKLYLLAIALLLGVPAFADDVGPPKPMNLQLPEQEALSTPECKQWCKPYWKSMPKEEYFFFVAEAADMLTTLDIKNHPDLEEKNPILGKHPSDTKVVGWCVAAALVHSAITYEMVDQGVPPKLIKAWEYVSIGVEGGFALHNWRVGLRFAF